jgi:hypothetical protein
MKAADVAALLSDAALPRTEPVEARVVRPVFGKPARPSAAPALSPDVERAQAEIVADLAARRARPRMQEGDRERIERFRRAILMAARLEAGGRVPAEDQRWLIAYRETPEHAAMKLLHEDFGDAIFG